jgi:hypothetical protein
VVNDGRNPGKPIATSAKGAFLVKDRVAWVEEMPEIAPPVGGGHELQVEVDVNKGPDGMLVPGFFWYTMVFALFRTVIPHSLEKAPTLVNESTKVCPGQTGIVKFCRAPVVNV